MNITIFPGKLRGNIPAIPSKSFAHRALICAAFATGDTVLRLEQTNSDIEATVDCLNALGADIQRTKVGYSVIPAVKITDKAVLNCRESGSTLRFLLPVVGALGVNATFHTEGRLGKRPLSPLWEEMERMGCQLSRSDDSTILCSGKLRGGEYQIAGNVSSQFISGLLFAGAVMEEELHIAIEGKLESIPYIDMTRDVLAGFGILTEGFGVPARQQLRSPGIVQVEGDWSNAAFFLAADALGSEITVTGLCEKSSQGDKAIRTCLARLTQHSVISAADIPDLIPILSVVAAANKGAIFTDIQRLRLKESDRVSTVIQMLEALGGTAYADDTTLTVKGTGLLGGTVDSCNDHRIAMAAAIAATVCSKCVTILSAEAVNKSYPRFWEDYRRLGGNYE